MIGKPITGKSFGGCVRYIVNKPEARILEAEGVRTQSAGTLTADFNRQRMMRHELGKAVGHVVLSWSKEDQLKLTDAIMARRAREYMELMGIKNTQYVIIRHTDRQHPHLHIIYNRVDNTGKTISDKNSYAKNIKACKEITEKHGYHFGKDKSRVNRQALRGKERIRHELLDQISSAAKTATSWKELEEGLKAQGIGIAYKYKNGTNEVQGISFEKGKLKMKGSAVDRSLSYANLDRRLRINQRLKTYNAKKDPIRPAMPNPRHTIPNTAHTPNQEHSTDTSHSLINTMLSPNNQEEMAGTTHQSEVSKQKRKKRKTQGQGIRR